MTAQNLSGQVRRIDAVAMRDEFILLRRGERPRFQQPVERRGGGVVATSTSSIGGIAPSDGFAGGSEIVELQTYNLPELGECVPLPGGVAAMDEPAAAQGMAVPGIHSWLIVPRTGSGASEKNVLAPRPRGDLPVGKAGSSAAVQATDGEWDGLNGSLQPSNHLSVRVVGHDLQMDPAGVNVGEDHRVGKTPCHRGATVGDGVDLEESRIPVSYTHLTLPTKA